MMAPPLEVVKGGQVAAASATVRGTARGALPGKRRETNCAGNSSSKNFLRCLERRLLVRRNRTNRRHRRWRSCVPFGRLSVRRFRRRRRPVVRVMVREHDRNCTAYLLVVNRFLPQVGRIVDHPAVPIVSQVTHAPSFSLSGSQNELSLMHVRNSSCIVETMDAKTRR